MFSRKTSSAIAAAAAVCAVWWVGCSGSGNGTGSGASENDASTSSSSSGSGSGGTSSSSGGGSDGGTTGSSSGSASGSGSSSGSGSGSSSGSGGDGGATCPTVPCTGGETCCADLATKTASCASSCPQDDTIQCIGPSDCSSAAPDCCATDVLDGMDAGESFPHCTTGSLTTTCVAKCVSKIQLSCTATETLHVCQAPADCTDDTANPNCCLVAGYHVCVSTILKNLGKLTCL